MATPNLTPEAEDLVARLERALHETGAGFQSGGMWVTGLFTVCAVIFAVRQFWAGMVFSALFGGGVFLLMRAAARKNTPERMRPVVDAVRDAPERVVSIRHYQTSDSLRLFVTHWLMIKTADAHLLAKAKDDWEPVLAMLKRRCPDAQIIES